MNLRKIKFESIVAETLLIPLYMRAKESKLKENAIFTDYLAEDLIAQIDYDYSKFNNSPKSEVGCIVRGWYFDNAVRKFIKNHKNPIVVNVGCGLDTRYQRIGDIDHAKFYEMDLPEVIRLRHELIPEPENDKYIPASILDTEWMDSLKESHPNGDFIFVIEGVIMYFYEKQVKSILNNIAKRFPGGELWLDLCGTIMLKKGVKPDSLRNHDAQIRFGICDAHSIENWVPHLKLITQDNYMRFFRPRWGFLMGQILGRFKKLCFRFSSLVGFRIIQ